MEIVRVEKRVKQPKTNKPKTKQTPKKQKEMTSNKKFLLVIVIIGLFLIICASIYRWQSNKKYQGYWCSYTEHSLVVVQLKDGHTEKQDQELEKLAETFENVISVNPAPKEGYEDGLGPNPDINDAYVISFSTLDNVGTYIEEIEKLDFVVNVNQQSAKSNMSLYNLKSFNNYTFSDSDEALEEDIETGKYKIKNGVITFTPKNKDEQTKLLYIKDKHLCSDPECTRIFASTNETCNTD